MAYPSGDSWWHVWELFWRQEYSAMNNLCVLLKTMGLCPFFLATCLALPAKQFLTVA